MRKIGVAFWLVIINLLLSNASMAVRINDANYGSIVIRDGAVFGNGSNVGHAGVVIAPLFGNDPNNTIQIIAQANGGGKLSSPVIYNDLAGGTSFLEGSNNYLGHFQNSGAQWTPAFRADVVKFANQAMNKSYTFLNLYSSWDIGTDNKPYADKTPTDFRCDGLAEWSVERALGATNGDKSLGFYSDNSPTHNPIDIALSGTFDTAFPLTIDSALPSSGVTITFDKAGIKDGIGLRDGGVNATPNILLNGTTGTGGTLKLLYSAFTTVTVTAQATAPNGNVFNTWVGCDAANGGTLNQTARTCTTSMSRAKNFIASYVAPPVTTPTVPTVTTAAATNITSSSATLNATIASDGGSTIQERRFDWGINGGAMTGWTANVSVSGNNFSYVLPGLLPNTTYKFRAWATNKVAPVSADWGTGSILTFTTGSGTIPVNGVCSTASGGTFSTAPTNLCSSGSATTVSGSGPWYWNCNGSNGGTSQSCSAYPTVSVPVNGVCGTANNSTFTTQPTQNLCSSGSAISMTGSGPWYWNCSGSNGGTNVSCSAYVTPTGSVPSCSISPLAASIVDGASQTFTASCTNSPLGYQWKVDGNLWSLGGAGPTSFDIFSGLAVGVHTVSVTANNSIGTSGPVSATLTVTSAVPSCSITPATASIAFGATQVFTANCTNSPSNYQWLLDGTLVGSGSINSYSTGTNLAAGLHTLTVTASNAGGPSMATSASLTIKPVQFGFTDSITGFVRDRSGAGLPNVSVRAHTGTGWGSGETVADIVTQPDGRYIIPLPKGTYTVGITTNTGCSINPCPPTYTTTVNDVSVNGQQVLDFTVPQLVTLSGRVTDANNIGVAGVSLNLQNLVTADLMMWYYPYIQPVQTGADGSYSIQVYPGSYDIGITNGSTSYLVATGVNIAADGVRDLILNATSAVLSGFVRDSANQGVGGVTVYVNTGDNWYGTTHGSTTTAPDGSYQLPLPQDGNYNVSIYTANNCVQSSCASYGKDASVSVTGNTVHDFALPPVVTLSGVVSNAGVGVPNASVNVWTPYDAGMIGYGGSYGYTSTAADGSYSLSVYAGSYNVNVSLPNGTNYSDNFIAAAGLNVSADTVQDFAVDAAPNSISGFVRDASGAGMGGIAINAWTQAGIYGYGSTVTAADGSYRIPLLPGTYTLQVGNNYYYCSPACPSGPLYSALLNNVSVNGSVTHDFIAPPVVTLSGRVVDVNGTPVGGMGVNALSTVQRGMYMYGVPSTMKYTDQNGYYSIPVYTGKYDIEVGVPSLSGGGLGTRYTAAANVAIAANTIRDLTLFNIYTPQNRISGRLIGSNGAAAFGYYFSAEVELTGSDIALTYYVDMLGNYSFSNLADGAYTITPSIRGYSLSPATRSITIAGASVSGADFQVCREGSSLTGVVLDAATHIALPSGSVLVDGVLYSVDATGHYSIPGLSCGTHDVAVNVPGYVSYSAALDTFNSWNVEIGLTKTSVAVPSAPTIGTAIAGNAQATVSFAAPANNGGSAITLYTVTSTPRDVTATGTASAIVVTGLTNGTAYTFTVTATNNAGTSQPSAASNAVTPAATYTVATSAGANGSISPVMQTVTQGNATGFTITPNTGYMALASGCGGNLVGSNYTTGLITADCTVSVTFTLPVLANLVPGWNLIGNGVDAPLNVATEFSDATKVTSVWKWTQTTSKWAFYAPSMTAPNLATYAVDKGFDVLTTINGGDGFWVNAKAPFTVLAPAGAAINVAYFQDQFDPLLNKLNKGWNLIGTGDTTTPSAFNMGLSVIPPAAGTIPVNVTTLWVWDNAKSNWYFYAPSLEAKGGTALTDYITGKGYLDFTANGKTLGQGVGFWVNRP